MLHEISLIAIT